MLLRLLINEVIVTGHISHYVLLAVGLIGRELDIRPFPKGNSSGKPPTTSHSDAYNRTLSALVTAVVPKWWENFQPGEGFPTVFTDDKIGYIWSPTLPQLDYEDGSPAAAIYGTSGLGDRKAGITFMQGLSDIPAYQNALAVGTNMVSLFPLKDYFQKIECNFTEQAGQGALERRYSVVPLLASDNPLRRAGIPFNFRGHAEPYPWCRGRGDGS